MWNRQIRLELQELLGEGSQGRVFKALRRDPVSGLGQQVAVKILHSKNAVDIWQKEFESLVRVRSPYCVQVYSFERLKGHPALILEFVEGVSLTKLVQGGWLSNEEIGEIMAQLECGILDLYRHGLFHGDLSPNNILIDSEGRVRILDFGLANGQQRLTPEFASPERLCGQFADLASDIYSLGRIEQFLNFTGESFSPYLQMDPKRRSLRSLSPNKDQQSKLGQRVSTLLERTRQAKNLRTQNLTEHKCSDPRAPIVAALLMVAMILICPSSQSLYLDNPAILTIRTHQWAHFKLNGRPVGYAPLNLVVPSNQRVRIDWQSATGAGEKVDLCTAGPGSSDLQSRLLALSLANPGRSWLSGLREPI